ncbi:MAG: hypothetical protein E7259_10660 [Lachnospiraceae bacterium]|nr:hypothetical protein [Lachnospiraceae bacterium]
MMKKILTIAIIAIIGLFIFNQIKTNNEEKINNDYEKIDQIKEMCETIANSDYKYSFGTDTNTWYIMELEVIHQKEDAGYSKMEEILGEDFITKLSNGDKIFIGFLPRTTSYRIYAGVPEESNMIYPDWNYTELEQK